MALKALITTLDGITDEHKELYIEREGGGYQLDVEESQSADGGTYGLFSPDALKGTLTKVRGELKDALKISKAFNGLDPDAIKSAIEFQTDYSGTKSEDYDKNLGIMREDFKTKVANHESELGIERAKVSDFLNGHHVDQALLAASDKLTPNAGRFIRDELVSRSKTIDGQPVIHSADGNPLPSLDPASAGFMSPSEYLSTMETNPEYGIFFKATQAVGGTGANQDKGPVSNGPAGKLNLEQYNALSGAEQNKVYNSDPVHYDTIQGYGS